jgi:UDP:flavonoid glycosyltransferase YjiC (YdhE family)
VTPKRLTAARLRAAIDKVRSTPAYGENARKLQQEIASLRALEYASEVIEAELQRRSL